MLLKGGPELDGRLEGACGADTELARQKECVLRGHPGLYGVWRTV